MESCAADRSGGVGTADEFWGDKDVQLIDEFGIEECSKDFAAPLDKEIGHLARAEFAEEGRDCEAALFVCGVRVRDADFDSRRAQLLDVLGVCVLAGEDEDGALIDGADELRIAGDRGVGIDNDPGRDSRPGRPRREERVVGSSGCSADEYGIAPAA